LRGEIIGFSVVWHPQA